MPEGRPALPARSSRSFRGLLAALLALLALASPTSAQASAQPAITGKAGPTAVGRLVDPRHLPTRPSTAAQSQRQIPYRVPNVAAFDQAKARANAAAAERAVRGKSSLGTNATASYPTLQVCDGGDGCWNPPDGALAVGPTSFLVGVNEAFAIYDKASGNPLVGPIDTQSFFGTAPNSAYDPHALYDAGYGRFVYLTASGTSTTSNYELAVSTSNAPQDATSGSWCLYALNAVTTQDGYGAWADYPGLGMDGNNLYITSDQFDFNGGFQQARLLVVPKASVYPTGTSCPTATSTDFENLTNPDGSSSFAAQPANEPDALPVPPTQTTAMYIVNALGQSGSQLVVRTVSTAGGVPTLSLPSAVNVSPYTTPADAPQPGGSAISNGDTLLGPLTYRYGKIYAAITTQNVDPSLSTSPNAYASVLWYTFAPGDAAAVSHAITDPNVAFFLPGITATCAAPDANGGCANPSVTLEVTGSGPTQPASAFIIRDNGTPALYAPGVAGYTGNGRWGDYPGAAADPTNPAAAWVLGEYAQTTTGWATAVTYNDDNPGRWDPSPSLPFAQTNLGAARGSDGRIYAVAGLSKGGLDGVLQAYTPGGGGWSWVSTLPTWRQDAGVTAGPDGRIYVIGGANQDDANFLDLVEVYDPVAGTWACSTDDTSTGCASYTLPPMPSPRSNLAATLGADGRIYALGGFNFALGNPLAIVEAYNPATQSWASLPPMPTARADLAAAAGSDGRIYAIGGFNANFTPYDLNTVEAYSPATNTWTAVASMPTARSALAAAVSADRIYAIGGFLTGGTFYNTVEAYVPSTNTWSTVASMSTARESFAAATGSDGRIYAIGGSSYGTNLNSVEVYTPGVLSPIPACTNGGLTASPPSPAAAGTAVTLTASVAGCTPLYRFWVTPPSGTRTLLQDYSSAAAFTWNTQGLSNGTYTLTAEMRAAGSADAPQTTASLSYVVQPRVGGTDLALALTPPGQVTLTWAAGVQQTGYYVVRLSPAGSTLLPGGGPLPASATSYTDTSGLTKAYYCYLDVPLNGGSALGNSDVLCYLPGLHIGAAPSNFSIELDQGTTAHLIWAAPGGQSAYTLIGIPLDGSAEQLINLPGSATSYDASTAAKFTCYVLVAQTGTAVTGNTDAVCGDPGLSSIGSNAAAQPLQTLTKSGPALQRLSTQAPRLTNAQRAARAVLERLRAASARPRR